MYIKVTYCSWTKQNKEKIKYRLFMLWIWRGSTVWEVGFFCFYRRLNELQQKVVDTFSSINDKAAEASGNTAANTANTAKAGKPHSISKMWHHCEEVDAVERLWAKCPDSGAPPEVCYMLQDQLQSGLSHTNCTAGLTSDLDHLLATFQPSLQYKTLNSFMLKKF